MTEQEIKEWTEKIQNMSHLEMARLYRFAPAGHPIFDNTLPLYKIFMDRYIAFGGMTTELSKQIGW